MHKTLCTKDSLRNETCLLSSKSKNTKEDRNGENSQMEKDLKTTKAYGFQHDECFCTIENLRIDNFCVLLAIVIVKATLKRAQHLPDSEHKSVSAELFLKYLNIETELMWHINPKNMMRSEQSFILSLFSTSCGLVNTLIQPSQREGAITNDTSLPDDKTKKILNEMSNDDTSINKEFITLSSDSEANTSSSEARSSNILISCVGRRSKRKKKRKTAGKSESNLSHSKQKNGIMKLEIIPIKSGDTTVKCIEDKIDTVAQYEDKDSIDKSSTDSKNVGNNRSGHQTSIQGNPKTFRLEVASDVKLDFVRVLIPNEQSGTIAASFVPMINKCQNLNIGTRVRDVMSVVSFKQKVANPHEYAIYLLTFESKDAMLNTKEENTTLDDVFHGTLYI